MGWYQSLRPKDFDQMFGQHEAVSLLDNYLRRNALPQVLLLSGPSGTGKTTAARILRKKVGCHSSDFYEINAAKERGIDMVRDISSAMRASPINKSRVWLIDECQCLTKDAQSALLVMLEDTPDWVYFFLATTHPQKIIPTVRSRCKDVFFRIITDEDMKKMLASILETKLESNDLPPDEVIDKIVDVSGGNARKAVQYAEAVAYMKTAKEQLDAIVPEEAEKQAIEIAKALIWRKVKWPEMAKILREVTEEPEVIRQIVLTCATNEMLKGGKLSHRAYFVINSFSISFFESGRAGLTAAAYEVVERPD